MTKTLIDVDQDLLIQAQQILDTTTKKATVNGALREIVRRDAAARFLDRARAGIFTSPAGQEGTPA
jgi:Arc/MetJ family transcription regulator